MTYTIKDMSHDSRRGLRRHRRRKLARIFARIFPIYCMYLAVGIVMLQATSFA